MKLVADVSAIIPYLLYQDKETTELFSGEDKLFAPMLYLSESGNTLLKYLNKNLITFQEVNRLLNQSKVIISQFIYLNDYSEDIIRLASQYNLTFYDSEYLFLTIAIEGKLISRDKKLNEVAQKLGVKF